jgi:hypothetical protein
LKEFALVLFIEGVPDAIIRKMTGHRSEKLERYKHFSPAFQQQTAGLIDGKLSDEISRHSGTNPGTMPTKRRRPPE